MGFFESWCQSTQGQNGLLTELNLTKISPEKGIGNKYKLYKFIVP